MFPVLVIKGSPIWPVLFLLTKIMWVININISALFNLLSLQTDGTLTASSQEQTATDVAKPAGANFALLLAELLVAQEQAALDGGTNQGTDSEAWLANLNSLAAVSAAPAAQVAAKPSINQVAANFQASKDNYSQGYDQLISDTAGRYGIDPTLVKAVVKAESDFNPNATSPVGARGLMQLMPSTGAAMGAGNLYDPAQNIEAGVKYLKQLLDHYQGNEQLAVAAYNAGPGAVDAHGGVPPYQETRQYVANVLAYRNSYLG